MRAPREGAEPAAPASGQEAAIATLRAEIAVLRVAVGRLRRRLAALHAARPRAAPARRARRGLVDERKLAGAAGFAFSEALHRELLALLRADARGGGPWSGLDEMQMWWEDSGEAIFRANARHYRRRLRRECRGCAWTDSDAAEAFEAVKDDASLYLAGAAPQRDADD